MMAPVKEPFSWPKSSDSMRFWGTAEQSKTMNGLFFRAERLWSVLATTSLPVPVSPSITTVVVVGAIFSKMPKISRILMFVPMMSPRRSFSTGRIRTCSSKAWNWRLVFPHVTLQPGLR